MKKRRLMLLKMDLREAYNEELRKMNILDTPNDADLTKAQIIEKLTELGIESSEKLKKDELLKLLEEANADKEKDAQPTWPEVEADSTNEMSVEDNSSENETSKDDILDTPNDAEDGEIEDVEIDEIVEHKEDTQTETTEAVTDSTPDGTVEEIEV